MTYLTERQKSVFGYIEQRLALSGLAPTLQEIADHFGFRSTASAQKHIALLEKKGFLRREKHQKRGLVLAERSPSPDSSGQRLPLLGAVAAGSPIESLPDDEEINVPTDLLRSGDHYVLRVRGESMIDDGIYDGDLVVVQQKNQAIDGETVVALVDCEVTLKRLFRQGDGTVRLQPANPSMEPMVLPGEQVKVQGVVVGLLRRY